MLYQEPEPKPEVVAVPRLTKYKVNAAQVLELSKGGATYDSIAAALGVSRMTVVRAIRRAKWRRRTRRG